MARLGAHCTIVFHDEQGDRKSVDATDAGTLSLEEAEPIRPPPRGHPGQPNLHGVYVFAKTGAPIWCESRLEMETARRCDYARSVLALSSQPCRLQSVRGRRVELTHVPDFFGLCADEPPLLIDVMRRDKAADPRRVRGAALAKQACQELGWRYAVAFELPHVHAANLRFLSDFRRDIAGIEEHAPRLLDLAREPVELGRLHKLASACEGALPVLFHLLWHQRLRVDLAQPLTPTTAVFPGDGAAS
jgi:hypothetical protein